MNKKGLEKELKKLKIEKIISDYLAKKYKLELEILLNQQEIESYEKELKRLEKESGIVILADKLRKENNVQPTEEKEQG